MTTALRSALLLGLIAFTGCASMNAQPLSSAGQVKTLIVCELAPTADRAAVLAMANDMAKWPRVLDVAAGYDSFRQNSTSTPDSQPTGDTVTFIITFQNSSALVEAEKLIQAEGQKLRPLCTNYHTFHTTLQKYEVSNQYTEENEAATRERRAAAIKQQNDLRSQTK